jgi:3D-(3,5/4)-trihydroxycyclohexane-1,2-dione acylhydrolase (decyclizing)
MSTSNETQRLTMAQALVKYLQVQYSERDGQKQRLIPGIFGIFGHGNVHTLSQALVEYGQNLPYYQPRHEQSMVHTAIGHAKATARRSTLACTSSVGPGATNMITGAATATINRLPVLLLPADYYVTRYQGPVLQQLEHPISGDVSVNDCFRPVSRFFDRISRPEQLLTALPEAMRVLTDPADTGAVTVCIPQDVQAHAYDYPAHFFEERVWPIERRMPDRQRIQDAVALLKAAERPVLVAGGGIHYSEARGEVQKFCEAFGIAVAETFAGKGAIQNDSDLLLGGLGVTGTPCAAKIFRDADLVICVGTRMADFVTGSQGLYQNPDVKFIGISVCGHDAYKQGAVPILADAREAVRELHKAAEAAGVQPNSDYVEEVAAAKREWQQTVTEDIYVQHPGEQMSQAQVIGALNETTTDGDVVVAAAGLPPGDLLKLWDATGGRGCHLEFGFSCMTYEIPASIGVRMAQSGGEVYVLIGDGTYLMNPSEIVTSVMEGLKITVVICVNHGFQSIRGLQLGTIGQGFGNEFRRRDPTTNRLEGEDVSVDFKQHAESMGAKGWYVTTPDDLCSALREARGESGACVIAAEISRTRQPEASGVWWDVAPAEVSGDEAVQKSRAQYEKLRGERQRLHY